MEWVMNNYFFIFKIFIILYFTRKIKTYASEYDLIWFVPLTDLQYDFDFQDNDYSTTFYLRMHCKDQNISL